MDGVGERREGETRSRASPNRLEDGRHGDILHLSERRVVPLHGGELLLGPLADAGGGLEELCTASERVSFHRR